MIARLLSLTVAFLITVSLCLPTAVLHAQESKVVKLATLVPDGSVWHKALLDLGDAWNRGTDGRVKLLVFAGGVAGDEPDMVRKMRIGQTHAAALTITGLAKIDPAFDVFGIPMMFESYPELFYVLDKMEPVLRKRLEEKGFVLLNWGHGGWVYFFTKEPVSTLAELKKTKMFAWAGDDRSVQSWKSGGFQPVALAATDILPGLNTGMINALPTTPLAAASLQWFRMTPYMADVGIGPLVGGLVMTKQMWTKIAAADQAVVQKACKTTEARLKQHVPTQDSTSVREMVARGLKVTKISTQERVNWRALADDFGGRVSETVPEEILALALRERDAYRKQAAAGGH
jgi:TRAP-type C4-dicarboxylate transport system substrate-binding protein